MQNEALRIL